MSGNLVYFVQAGEGGPIKIGVSADPAERMMALKAPNGRRDLRLLAVTSGGYTLESRLHRELAEHRLEGEWFANAPAVRRQVVLHIRWSRALVAERIAQVRRKSWHAALDEGEAEDYIEAFHEFARARADANAAWSDLYTDGFPC